MIRAGQQMRDACLLEAMTRMGTGQSRAKNQGDDRGSKPYGSG